MNREHIEACKKHIGEALRIMEDVADTQPEVHLLIALREVMEDLVCLEMREQLSGTVVRLSDARQLRILTEAGAA